MTTDERWVKAYSNALITGRNVSIEYLELLREEQSRGKEKKKQFFTSTKIPENKKFEPNWFIRLLQIFSLSLVVILIVYLIRT